MLLGRMQQLCGCINIGYYRGGVRNIFHVPEGVKFSFIGVGGGSALFSMFYKGVCLDLNITSNMTKTLLMSS